MKPGINSPAKNIDHLTITDKQVESNAVCSPGGSTSSASDVDSVRSHSPGSPLAPDSPLSGTGRGRPVGIGRGRSPLVSASSGTVMHMPSSLVLPLPASPNREDAFLHLQHKLSRADNMTEDIAGPANIPVIPTARARSTSPLLRGTRSLPTMASLLRTRLSNNSPLSEAREKADLPGRRSLPTCLLKDLVLKSLCQSVIEEDKAQAKTVSPLVGDAGVVAITLDQISRLMDVAPTFPVRSKSTSPTTPQSTSTSPRPTSRAQSIRTMLRLKSPTLTRSASLSSIHSLELNTPTKEDEAALPPPTV